MKVCVENFIGIITEDLLTNLMSLLRQGTKKKIIDCRIDWAAIIKPHGSAM